MQIFIELIIVFCSFNVKLPQTSIGKDADELLCHEQSFLKTVVNQYFFLWELLSLTSYQAKNTHSEINKIIQNFLISGSWICKKKGACQRYRKSLKYILGKRLFLFDKISDVFDKIYCITIRKNKYFFTLSFKIPHATETSLGSVHGTVCQFFKIIFFYGK